MKIQDIIKDLEICGKGTKQKVLNELKNASVEELQELIKSIQELIKVR